MVSRSVLIEKLLNGREEVLGAPSTSHASWDDIQAFENDTFREVKGKLPNLDNLIWGKVIVMERNTRTAKAYLRNSSIRIDGSRTEFDGIRFGLRRYSNPQRDEAGEKTLEGLEEGVSVRIDGGGSVWVRSNGGSRLFSSRGMNSTQIEPCEEVKIFDLRQFKADLMERENGLVPSRNFSRRHPLTDCVVYIKFSPAPALTCPLWLCLVHLIAVEMTFMLNPFSSPALSESAASPTSSFSSSSSSSNALSARPLPSLPIGLFEGQVKPGPYEDSVSASSVLSSSVQSSSASEHKLLISNRNRSISFEKASAVITAKSREKYRGGVKKKLVRTNLHYPECPEMSLAAAPQQTWRDPRQFSSVVDLRCLDEMKRPAYFCDGLTKRGGAGHHGSVTALNRY